MPGTTELAVRNGSAPAQASPAALSIRPGQTTFDDFQNAALNQLGLKNASNADRAVFLHQCQRTGLDPFAKQIMMIERREKQGDNWVSKWTIQTGIEGWRTVRDRAERREGLRGILSRFTYYDADDNERKVWTRAEPPAVAEVTYTVVEATGREVPYTSQLRFDEYVQTKEDKNGNRYRIAQWATKPVHMLEKCTEADVYRRTFPQDYAGIELSDAMPPAEVYDEPAQQRQRVTAADARARNPQTVTAVVVTPDVPPAGEQDPSPATPAGGTPQPASSGQVGLIRKGFERLYPGPEAPDDRVQRLIDTAKLAGLETDLATTKDLTADQAARVLRQLDRVADAKALEALLSSGEVPGE